MSIATFLASSPTFYPFVKELTFRRSLHEPAIELAISTLQCALSKLPRLQVLRIENATFLPDHDTLPLYRGLSPEPPWALHTLHVLSIHIIEYVDVLRCLALFNHIDDLKIHSSLNHLAVPADPLSGAFPMTWYPSVSMLHLFNLSAGVNNSLLTFFAETRAPDALKKFGFCESLAMSSAGVKHFLRSLRPLWRS